RQRALECLLAAASGTAEGMNDEVYAAALETKGSAFELSSARRRALASSLDPKTKELVDRLQSVRAAMSNLFSIGEIRNRDQLERDIEHLRKDRVELETRLAKVADARAELKAVTPAELRDALPSGVALLDFVEHRLYEPVQWKDGVAVRLGRW